MPALATEQNSVLGACFKSTFDNAVSQNCPKNNPHPHQVIFAMQEYVYHRKLIIKTLSLGINFSASI